LLGRKGGEITEVNVFEGLVEVEGLPHSAEQVLPPAIVGPAQHAHKLAAGVEAEGARRPQQPQPSLFRQAVAFAIVAGVTASHQVVPVGVSPTRARDDVIER